MPLPVDRLDRHSGKTSIGFAIDRSVAQLIKEGRKKDQAVAIAYEIARKQTGKKL